MVAVFGSVDLRDNAGRIICTDFGGASTPWPCTYFIPCRHEFDGFEASGVVWSDRGSDDVQER